MNALSGQSFDERMVAQADAESKQLKVLIEKTEVVFEYAQTLIDDADEHTKKTSELAKAIAEEREENNLRNKRLS